MAKGDWTDEIYAAHRSSTWRELHAMKLVLQSLASWVEGSSCIHRSDNQAAVHIVKYGSRKPHLQKEALEIHKFCRQFNVQLSTEWVPREENELADYYSKLVDEDDWQVHPAVFAQLDERWGRHTLDCFASHKNKQLERYCSRWPNPGCLAIDAFTVSWERERVWLAPPIHLISRTLKMFYHFKCHGTLIIPKWQSAHWWPLIWSGVTWQGIVRDVQPLPKIAGLFLLGICRWNLFGAEAPKCEVLAIKLCSVSPSCC